MKYTLVQGFHNRVEDVQGDGSFKRVMYRPKDTIELTKKEAEWFGERVKPVLKFEEKEAEESTVEEPTAQEPVHDEAEAADAAEEVVAYETDEPADVDASILDEHGQKVKSLVRHMDDVTELSNLYQVEAEGKVRDSVLEEISARISELTKE